MILNYTYTLLLSITLLFAVCSVSERREATLPSSETSSGRTSRPEPAERQQPSQTPPRPPGPSRSHRPPLASRRYLFHARGVQWRLLLWLL